MKLNKVHHIAIICSDYQRSLDFYTRILGMNIIAENYRTERQSYKTDLALGDAYVIELFSFPTPPARLTRPEAVGLRHLAFEVDNIVEAVKAIVVADDVAVHRIVADLKALHATGPALGVGHSEILK